MKDYVVEKTLPEEDSEGAIRELEDFLRLRIENAVKGEVSERSVLDIMTDVNREFE